MNDFAYGGGGGGGGNVLHSGERRYHQSNTTLGQVSRNPALNYSSLTE
jgi:hypothetical protein